MRSKVNRHPLLKRVVEYLDKGGTLVDQMGENKKPINNYENYKTLTNFTKSSNLERVPLTTTDSVKMVINKSNKNGKINFVNRLKDSDRKHIRDWEDPSKIATHKLGYAEADGKYYVYPSVQEIDGNLYDFTDPKYNHGKFDALDHAISTGDFLEVDSEDVAKEYTTTYKDYYPKFNYTSTNVFDDKVKYVNSLKDK